jgi:HPt (histidine-containing phosphotransfer) domain-containing protein
MDRLDISLLEELREVMPEDMRNLITEFELDTRKRLSILDTAILTRDAPTLRSNAHCLKGGAASLGAVSLSEQFFALEVRAKEEYFEGIEDVFAKIQHDFEETINALQRWLT